MEGDVLDISSLSKAIQGVCGVFHLAGIISIMPGKNPIVRKVNVEGTRNMMQIAKEMRVKKLVYTSSIHAIQRIEGGMIDERLPYDSNNPYGEYDRSKAEATLEVQQAANTGQEAVIVCPTGVIGPYDFRGSMMGSVIHDAAFAKPTLYVDGAYNFVDVRDVADGMIAAFDKGRARRKLYLIRTKNFGAIFARNRARDHRKTFLPNESAIRSGRVRGAFYSMVLPQVKIHAALYAVFIGSAAKQLQHQPCQGDARTGLSPAHDI